MLFANPVEAQYIEGAFYDRSAAPYYLSPDKLESDYAPVRFARELRLFRQFCRRGSVLDVGCSTGAFLHQLQKGFANDYSVLGTDVSGPALAYAESRGVPVRRGHFLEDDFGAQRFAAITFWAVLEHVAEPRRFLEKAGALLEPGGHGFVLVPNMRSLAVRLVGSRYRYLMPEHLNYFAADTLGRLVAGERAFSLVTVQSTHLNPVVLWQDWWRTRERVPEEERARLLKRTTAWKQNAALMPLRLAYGGLERCLGAWRLADNLVAVLRRR
jgi:2-polyprenyl-3-methyl-5-hydroxy-6-metoxy-1,4-benzoquinol methylase